MQQGYLRTLIQVIPLALGGLVLGCVVVGLCLGAWRFFGAASFSGFAVAWALGLYIALFAIVVGFCLTLLYGAPAYSLLVHTGHASFLSAGLIGAIPGALMWVGGSHLWPLYTLFGVVAALCTHALARRHGPNKSFKPNPLRGSA